MAKTTREDSVIQAIRSQGTDTPGLITLSTGVILKASRVPNMIFPEVMGRFKRPEVPTVFIEDLGREEKNPDDPRYKEEYNDWQTSLSLAIVDTMIVLGTEVQSLPKGFDKHTDDRWTMKLRVLGIDPGTDEMKRYLLWVKYVAAPTDEDITRIMEGVGGLSGVTEDSVNEAIGQFRNRS